MVFQFIRWRLTQVLAAAALALTIPEVPTHGSAVVWDPDVGWQVEGGIIGDQEIRRADAIITRMNQARRWHEVGHHGSALRLYREIYRDYPETIFAPEAIHQAARIRMDRRQWSRAFEQLQNIVENYPGYPRFHRVIEHQFTIAHNLDEGARGRLIFGLPGFRNRERAVEYYEQLVENAPYSEQAPLALLNAANVQYERGRHEEAIDLYDRFISDYPRHELVPDAYLGLAAAFATQVRGPEYDQGATREAIGYFEDFTILHPDHPRVAEAEEGIEDMSDYLAQSRIVLGDFYLFRRSNFHAARVFYNEAITIAPGTPAANEAREKLQEVERREQR